MVKELIKNYVFLQSIDTQLVKINQQLDIIPEMLKGSFEKKEKAAELAVRLEADLIAKKDVLSKCTAEISAQKSLLENSQKKLSSVKNSKEYQAALKELDVLKKKINDDESLMSSLNADIEKLEAEHNAATTAANTAESDYAKEKEERELENKELFERRDDLVNQRSNFIKEIKPQVLSKYEKVRSARAGIAIVKMIQESCSGCSMRFTPQMVVNIKRSTDLQQCPHCQRFVYYEEEVATESEVKAN